MKHSQGFLALVDDAMQRVQEIDAAELLRRLEHGERLLLVDVREDHEWEQGHLPGAVHLGKGTIERDIETRIPDQSAPIVLYCGGGYRSALAADAIQRMGYRNVLSLAGGFRGWRENGHAVEHDDD
ncbi:MAG: rhodanese-like domain-containing protein [Longimicrobiales bacterium]